MPLAGATSTTSSGPESTTRQLCQEVTRLLNIIVAATSCQHILSCRIMADAPSAKVRVNIFLNSGVKSGGRRCVLNCQWEWEKCLSKIAEKLNAEFKNGVSVLYSEQVIGVCHFVCCFCCVVVVR